MLMHLVDVHTYFFFFLKCLVSELMPITLVIGTVAMTGTMIGDIDVDRDHVQRIDRGTGPDQSLLLVLPQKGI